MGISSPSAAPVALPPQALLCALAELAPSLDAHQLRFLLPLAAAGGTLSLSTRALQQQTGLSTGTLARARRRLEEREHIRVRRVRRSMPSAYEIGPALAVLAESACSTHVEHVSTVQQPNSGQVLHHGGASPVDKCSTMVEQAEIPCSTQMEQDPATVEQAHPVAPPCVAAAPAPSVEQAPRARVKDRFDCSIDRSMFPQTQTDQAAYRADAPGAEAALDRVVSISHGRKFAQEEIEHGRNWLMSYMAKHPPKSGKMPPAAPDDTIVRQFLSIAAPAALQNVLFDLHADGYGGTPAGESWGWFISVALQRIWGIPPQRLRQRREQARRKPEQRETTRPLAFSATSGGRA